MGSFRSKEDDVSKISTSIFVTNFPESFTAKDLFHSCKVYGHVVDSFIPLKRSREGKRFGFVRFINVFNVERAPANGNPKSGKPEHVKNDGENNRNGAFTPRKGVGSMENGKSFVDVLSDKNRSESMGSESSTAIVLDDDFKSKDLFRDNTGAVSWFSVLRQASNDFMPEGRIVWVEVEGIPFKVWSGNTFNRIAAKWGELLDFDDQEDLYFHSKRLCIYTKLRSNIFENFKIVYRGKVCWIRAKEVPGWVPEFLDDSDDESQSEEGINDHEPLGHDEHSCGDDNDVNEVAETLFDESSGQKKNHSEDPFGFYSLLNKNKDDTHVNGTEDEQSIKYPPGFTPEAENREFNLSEENVRSTNVENLQQGNDVEILDEQKDIHDVKGSKTQASVSACSGKFKRSAAPETGGSILCLLEELVKVGRTMGYNMEGCLALKAKKDWVKELCVKNRVNFLALQETKMESIDLLSVKLCWGNLCFDHVHSDSVGNSGGILCVWDPNSFRKNNVTVSDYFVIIRGVWLKTNVNLLIVVVYAPQDSRDKRMLWDYLTHVSSQWDGEVVMMGDFNEVRFKSDRFGLVFNVRGADVFNSFIANASLVEVPLGGSAFTWSHKSATKMSKIDRFLISDGLMNTCPNINAITLERYLSNHRPILFRESTYDYGPIPFRFYHHWLALDGFDNFVIDIWRNNPGDKSNAMRKLMYKLKFLKVRIRGWLSTNRNNTKVEITRLIGELEKLDEVIDNGNATDDTVPRRLEVLNSIQNLNQIQTIEATQKAKIKWSVEGDENWIEEPSRVKEQFFQHFRDRFDEPKDDRVRIDMCFSRSLSNEQKDDLDCMVSMEEVKRAVWDCGMDKSPGPDGFSPTEEFQFFKGLKQGDPLSPFLFILIMESLHLSFQRVVDAGMYTGIKLCSSLNLSHLFYADDVMFVGQWCDSNINTLVHALECFHRASGLKINMSKSKILGIHVEDVKVKQAASKLGCLILNTPFSYLGTKVGGSMSRVHAWDEVVEKVTSRLSRWKMKTLSIGGRLTLLNRFFKGHELGSNKASWVKWSNVLASKEKGGLGVSSLYALNRGLLFKWVWKFYAQKTSLWARVIKAIHGVEWKVGKVVNSGASSCWTSIVREVEVLKQQGVNFFEYLQLNMGNGESTTFWEDRWLEGYVLKDIFPCLYVLETNKKVSVGDKLKDFRYVWSLYNSGDFSVAYFRKVIDENRYPGGRSRTRWAKYVPIKVNVTAWEIKMDALPTRLNISRRGMDIQSLSCPICDRGVESSSHLFFQCNLVRQVVRKISSWWNIDYVDVNISG
ncbi:RNA-directed DNA polymerase, eukaryota [Tanacetum coccineum]